MFKQLLLLSLVHVHAVNFEHKAFKDLLHLQLRHFRSNVCVLLQEEHNAEKQDLSSGPGSKHLQASQ